LPDFSYTALAGAQRQTGVLTANSEREALAQLDSRGLIPLKIAQKKSATEGGPRIKVRALASFYGQLADLLQSGVPLSCRGHGPVPSYGFPSQGFQRVGRQHGACRPRRWFS